MIPGLRTSPVNLADVLSPLTRYFDDHWWYFGGNGVNLFDADDYRAASEELSLYVDDEHGYRAGRPGFFSRYGRRVDFNWATHFASDLRWPFDAFAAAAAEWERRWFDRPEVLPDGICLLARDIDGAYHDFFFRDEWAFETVWAIAQHRPTWHAQKI
jgi:hypothetical protein